MGWTKHHAWRAAPGLRRPNWCIGAPSLRTTHKLLQREHNGTQKNKSIMKHCSFSLQYCSTVVHHSCILTNACMMSSVIPQQILPVYLAQTHQIRARAHGHSAHQRWRYTHNKVHTRIKRNDLNKPKIPSVPTSQLNL
jgi:hypothetical protein